MYHVKRLIAPDFHEKYNYHGSVFRSLHITKRNVRKVVKISLLCAIPYFQTMKTKLFSLLRHFAGGSGKYKSLVVPDRL